MNRTPRALLVLPLLLLAGACTPDRSQAQPPASFPAPAVPTGDPAALAAAAVAAMSDADLAGEVPMPYAYGSAATSVDAASAAGDRRPAGVDTPAQMIAKYHLGGLILVSFSAADPTSTTNPTCGRSTRVSRPPSPTRS